MLSPDYSDNYRVVLDFLIGVKAFASRRGYITQSQRTGVLKTLTRSPDRRIREAAFELIDKDKERIGTSSEPTGGIEWEINMSEVPATESQNEVSWLIIPDAPDESDTEENI